MKGISNRSLQFEFPGVRQFIRKTQSDFGWDWVSVYAISSRIWTEACYRVPRSFRVESLNLHTLLP